MSLIEEALRRVQDPTIPQVQTPSPKQDAPASQPPAHSWQAPASSRDRWSRALPLVAAVIFVVTGALVMLGAQWIRRTLGAPAAQSMAPRPSALAAQTSALEAPRTPAVATNPKLAAAKAPKQEEFTLTGLVEGQGAPLAVINGDIHSVGDRVGSATLIRIAEGVVQLRRDNGQEISLQVPR